LTTQTIGAKESLRDIARVYGYEDRQVEIILDTIVDDKLSLRTITARTRNSRR
jgi:DNA polymerase III alpha subunit